MGLFSGLFGGSSKTKVKREIPKPTKEEQDLLNRLLDITNRPIEHYPGLVNELKNPYQSLNSPLGLRLMEIVLGGYARPPGFNRLLRYGARLGYDLPSSTYRYGYVPRQESARAGFGGDIWEAIANYGLDDFGGDYGF